MGKTNYYFIGNMTCENDVEAINMTAKLANTLGNTVECRVCGTKERVAMVTSDGSIGCD